MEKRQFLSTVAGAAPAESAQADLAADSNFSRYANAVLPKRAAVAAGVEPYAGPWGKAQAMHLLRRTLFGFTQADLDKALSLTAATAVDALLEPGATPAPPVVVNATVETGIPVGTTWVDQPYFGDANFERGKTLQSWCMGLLLHQEFSIREKMTLFWHNHFATEWRDVGDSHYSYLENAMLRADCLGNFKALAKKVTLAPAMLRYLNGNTNTKANPNENYGRELQELFTIGKGPEISAGNYTNYTEEDVKAAARVLTGWRDLRDTRVAEFRPTQHDATNKTFSAAYGGAVITGRTGADGAKELDDLLDLIFAQAETARYLCRKLYRHFVYYAIDDATEKAVIEPMAALLRKDWEVEPVVALLLKSAHFHHAANVGCMIKSPLDVVVGTFRALGAALPDASDPVKQYAVWRGVEQQSAAMQQELLSPPNVAGWPAYYQDPLFYQTWISSDTLPKRIQFTDRCVTAKGFPVGTNYLPCDLVAQAKRASEPGNLAVIIPELSALLHPFPLTAKQHDYLKGILLDGAPTYEWGDEWAAHIAAPDDKAKRAVVETRLRALFKAMLALAEYQLC
jgi:uncharacterized protein (DUF1800 family)